MIRALRSRILILIAPPTFMTIGMIFVYHKRNRTRDDAGHESDREWKNNDPSDDRPSKDW